MIVKVEQFIGGYGKCFVIKDINFELNKGEIVGFIGFNGVGKSIMIKYMLGLFIFMEGFLLILDININDDIEVYRRKLFYILELLVIYEEFILEEYIEMIVMVYDIDCDEVMN